MFSFEAFSVLLAIFLIQKAMEDRFLKDFPYEVHYFKKFFNCSGYKVEGSAAVNFYSYQLIVFKAYVNLADASMKC